MTDIVSSSDTVRSRRARTLIIRAVLIGGIIGAALSLIAGDFGRHTVFDTWQRASPLEMSDDNVVVVMIDDESVAETRVWPWPRYQMAQLIELIGRSEPAAIGIDIYFVEPDPVGPEEFVEVYLEDELDAQMRERILALPNMDDVFADVIGTRPVVMARTAIETGGVAAENAVFSYTVAGTPPEGTLQANRLLYSIDKLDLAAFSQGMVNGQPDDDGILRRVPLSMQVGDNVAPGFALELARIASGEEDLSWNGRELTMGDRVLPTDNNAQMRFKMARNTNVPQYSALQVFNGELSPEVFQGKTVIVGVGATGTYDIVATPLQSEVDGVLLQAMAVDAILDGAWLDRPDWIAAVEIVAALCLLALVFLAAFAWRTWLLWPAFAFAITLPFASWIAYTQANLLFDPVRPLMVGICAAIAVIVTRYAIARSERTRLAMELVEERVAASEQKGELEAARRIQMSMVPGEKTLSRLDHRTQIGRILRPAKSVGGDFFDAVKISENLLLFLVADVTGKGVPAALFMALSKTLSKSNLARAGDGLHTALAALNFDLMDEADDEMGLTMLVGTIDCSTGAVQMINAGHENPMILRKDGSVDTIAMKGGPPLCVIDFPYKAEPVELAAGETLVIISDGATEAANNDNALFGMTGVVDALRSAGDATAQERATHLADKIAAFEGANDPTDDLTIFALRYLGSAD